MLFSYNDPGELFPEANGAISNFVETLKELNLWDSTAIVMGSDFGRSLNPNSNGGSDHAWGGNYFLLGGKVNGGQILGTYPYPLTPEHPKWIGRGRFIPTTPWDAVWNGIGNWMGLQLDDDLDFALPNRKSFSKCDDLFYDTDLFVDGACTCHECVEVTYSPTISHTTRAVSSICPFQFVSCSMYNALTILRLHLSIPANQPTNARANTPSN